MIHTKKLTLCLSATLFSTLTMANPAIPGQVNTTVNTPSSSTGLLGPSEAATAPVTPAQTTVTIPSSAPNTLTTPPTGTTTSVITTQTTPAVTVVAPVSSNAPLNQPNMTDDAVAAWAANVAKAVYSYDFKNHAMQMENNRQYFTAPGWKAFTDALNRSNNIKVVESKKLVASATPNGKPVVLSRSLKDGLYTWRVQVPVLATYESESRLIKQNLIVNILISRSATNPKGVGISHFVAVVVPGTPQPTTNITVAPNTSSVQSVDPNAPTTSIYGAPSGTTTPNTGMPSSTDSTITPPAGGAITSPSTVAPGAPNTLPPSTPVTPQATPGMPSTMPSAPSTMVPVNPNNPANPAYPQ